MRVFASVFVALIGCTTGPRESDVGTAHTLPETPVAATSSDGDSAGSRDASPVSIELTFVGDVILGRFRESGYSALTVADRPLFADVTPLIRSDLPVANLETPLVFSLPRHRGSGFHFGATAEQAKELVRGGFAAVSIANNHAVDLGPPGLRETPAILEAIGVRPIGRAVSDGPSIRVETFVREGVRIATIAATTRLNGATYAARADAMNLPWVSIERLADAVAPVIERARANHDFVLVILHWGNEYDSRPTKTQVEVAHQLVEHGADVVVGHHPHVLQAMEAYRGALIAYSLGNFVFDNHGEVPKMTGVLRVRLQPGRRGVSDAWFHPVCIDRALEHHPRVPPADLNAKIVARIVRQGLAMGTTWEPSIWDGNPARTSVRLTRFFRRERAGVTD